MKHSGYSGTPLSKKLGIKENFTVSTLQVPTDYVNHLKPLPEGVNISPKLLPDSDIVHAFVHNIEELENHYPSMKKAIHKNGMVWISWPKGSSGIKTDINRDILREFVLKRGLVDVKVASYDDTYSSLKFVYRVKDR